VKAIITGATGFLGANLLYEFAEREWEVLACDIEDPPPGLKKELSANERDIVSWHHLDVTKRSDWNSLPDEGGDLFVHGAAVTPGDDDPNPPLTAEVNVVGTLHALEWARRRDIRRFVYVSSSAVYRGVQAEGSLREDIELDPPTTYGKTKVVAESFVRYYADLGPMEAFSVRLPSLYGPWERPTGSRPNMSAVFELMRAAFTGKQLRVSGSSAARDWTYAPDVARAVADLSGVPWEELPDVLNISTGRFVNLETIVRVVMNYFPDAGIHLCDEGEHCAELQITPTSGERPMDVCRLEKAGVSPGSDFTGSFGRYVEWLSQSKDHEEVLGINRC